MAGAKRKLKAPFPYFGGKSRCVELVWDRFGEVDNYIEPFAGSAAMILGRPSWIGGPRSSPRTAMGGCDVGIPANHPAILDAERKGLIQPGATLKLANATVSPVQLFRGTESRVTLPLPPSANALFVASGRVRVKAVPYKHWIEAAAPLVAQLRPPSLPTRFFYLIKGKVNESRDGDNMAKPLLDVCVTAGVIPNDSLRQVRGACWDYDPGEGPPAVIVWFEEWKPWQ